ncbi:UbiA-domain-containing protein [Xylariaceae sp. FL0255]|nr:UbiA-domain-containing protein [Xylariaceae sp. FL0255]
MEPRKQALHCDGFDNTSSKKAQESSLSQQYGGLHARGWVDYLPELWVPWIQLCRLSPPAALFLVYFPPIFGVLHATVAARAEGSFGNHHSAVNVLYVCAVLFPAAFFGSNAAHAWNDLIDAPLDAQVARTRDRPIPRGAISVQAAALFALAQAICVLTTLWLFLSAQAAMAALPAFAGTAYYPFAKRHLDWPQVVLGFCLTWAIMVGSSAVAREDSTRSMPWTDASTLALLLAAMSWVVIFDTVYAHQDIADDVRLGIGSTAVAMRRAGLSTAFSRRLPLWALLTGMVAGLTASGYLADMGMPYYVLTVGGSALSVGAMVASVNLDDPVDCWRWFSQGFWATGLAIATGLVVEYLRLEFVFF